MRDTWMGSGVNSRDILETFDCTNCNATYLLDAVTDDGGHMAYAECPDCKMMLEKYIQKYEED